MRFQIQIFIFAMLLTAAGSFWFSGLKEFSAEIQNNNSTIPQKPMDAIVVLTGGSNRIDEAFNLLEKKLGKKMLISGVHRTVDTKQLLDRWKKEPQHELDCCVALDFNATNTVQNAEESLKWMKKNNFKSMYLVTSNYHMKRALLEFKRISDDIEITPFSVVSKDIDMDSWWKSVYSRDIIAREYTKYVIVSYIYLITDWMRL